MTGRWGLQPIDNSFECSEMMEIFIENQNYVNTKDAGDNPYYDSQYIWQQIEKRVTSTFQLQGWPYVCSEHSSPGRDDLKHCQTNFNTPAVSLNAFKYFKSPLRAFRMVIKARAIINHPRQMNTIHHLWSYLSPITLKMGTNISFKYMPLPCRW